MVTSLRRAPRSAANANPRDRHRSPGELQIARELWAEQLAYMAAHPHPDCEPEYLAAHFAMEITLQRHLRAIDQMFPYIRGRVLEWGCRHALDSCVYRHRLGDSVELFGCDICDGIAYAPFHEFAALRYTRLNHPFELPHETSFFDVVTSNGVLEHVPNDAASVGEVYRVLRPGGTFAITCLPNRLSYTEALQRWRGRTAHDRLYSIASTRRLVEAAGFRVIKSRRFLMLPTMLNGLPPRFKAMYQTAHRGVWILNDALERIWPVNHFASNVMLIARKPE